MRVIRAALVVSLLSILLSSCAFVADDVNVDLSLQEAKARTQAIEREIADALPDDLVLSVDQNETGSFLSCSRDGGEQWAGGLTALVRKGASARLLLDPVEQLYTQADDLVVSRWESDGDSILEVVGPYRSTWIVRYDPGRKEVHVSSFSPCIHLPDDVWRGGTF